MSAQRVAIAGGSGQLGTALREALAGRDVIAPPHAELPFEDRAALERLLDGWRPDVLVNCTAFHHVDTCEREPARAFAMNALAVDAAAEACAARGIAYATVSTDYVFDGTLGRALREDDAPNPLTAYGASKLAGELLTRRHGKRHLIVRTSGVFGTAGTSNKGYTLIEKVLRQAERGEPTRMVADMVFSPSYAPHVARAVRDLIDAQAYGTHHVTNAGACSWYAFVATAFRKAGLSGAPLEPVTYAALGNPTKRPMYSPLENTTFARSGIAPLPPWEIALDEFLAVRDARSAAAR
ncbi:MAG: dTDP-4-dehydrorhamnose reductase [Candidatus Eremiobacteraeota bacterium]|nr:dTDP-4-dehydrorhamnose reductase [Candidatus Eremiobacteraeota bacterium]